MTPVDNPLPSLRRPRLLISAARFGLGKYNRECVLPRIFDGPPPMPGRRCLADLACREAEQDHARRKGAATYSVAAHVEILTALIAEARLFSASRTVS